MIRGQTSPSVSVIVPAYNSAATIDAALESVRAQTWTDWECIVVDDASTDETREKVRSSEFGGQGVGVRGQEVSRGGAEDAEEKMVRGQGVGVRGQEVSRGGAEDAEEKTVRGQGAGLQVRLIAMDRNGGPAAARNAGAAVARGEWLAFLDADDAWYPHRLARQHEALKDWPDAVMLCGEADRFVGAARSHPIPPVAAPRMRLLTLATFVENNSVATSTVLLKRDVFRAAGGFDEAFRGPEDLDLWLRVAALQPILMLQEPLAAYRVEPGSLSLDEQRFLPEVMLVLDKAFGRGGALADHPEWRAAAESTQYWNASWMAFSRGDRTAALSWWWQAYRRTRRVSERVPRAWFRLLVRYVVGRRPRSGNEFERKAAKAAKW